MKKQSLIKGTFILGIAGILAKFLGIFFRWPLVMLIGDEGLGYYQMSYPLYMFFIATASGIPVAVSKMVSERNAVGDNEGIIQVLKKAILLMIIIGGGFSVFLSLFSKQLVSFFNWDQKSYYSLIGIAFAPLIIGIMSAFRGLFQGLQNMSPTAVSQILEQMGRVIVGVGLAYILIPKGIEYSAGGAAFGAAAGGLLGGIYLIRKYVKVKKELGVIKVRNNIDVMGKLLYIAIPISLGAAVGTVMSLIDSILVPQKLLQAGFDVKRATELYGQLTGKAFVLVNVPLTLSIALSASLVPIISEAFILGNKKEVERKVQLATRVAMVIGIPSFCGLFFMSDPIFNLIFPGHADGALILKYLSISIPFIVLAQTNTAILQGVGRYRIPVLNLIIACIVKIFVTINLVPIPAFNVYGAVIGTVTAYIIAAILNVTAMTRTLKVKINYYDVIIKPAYAAILMTITVVFIYIYVYNNTMSISISCLAAISIGALVYSILIILFGIFSYAQIKTRLLKRGVKW
ncbi:MAG: polysaccharide biosynthesis protein [Bacillota bacterium]|nr:polysaccharide biosynthesis protein [Bacillota bacterium]